MKLLSNFIFQNVSKLRYKPPPTPNIETWAVNKKVDDILLPDEGILNFNLFKI